MSRHGAKRLRWRFWREPQCLCGWPTYIGCVKSRVGTSSRPGWNQRVGKYPLLQEPFVTRAQYYRSNGGHGADR